ncbi:AI-2E family transporter [Sagittula sp. NFXS13]|uniref:Putative PurR-regulated permease PerM n=1 Tax=Sagittula marina TaxID=943940 RepID=A0A7W6GQR6_9RHOB|nr:AI-2E family transporter [Sagittula marina]MBB3983897.1 putative PurR-regulated permease PerM [Sagittula marina]
MWRLTNRETRIAAQALILIAALATIAAMKLAGDLVAPVALGLVVGVVLAPFVNRLGRLGVPRAVSASVALFLAVVLLLLFISALGPVMSGLMEEIPKIQSEIRDWVDEIVRMVRGAEALGREIEETIAEGGDEAVKAAVPTLIDALWMAPNFAAQALIFAGTLFFFVLTADEIYKFIPTRAAALRDADRAVSHYFVTVTFINACLGLGTFGVMTLIGLPNAMLWGGAAFILNFVLYLGPVMMMAALLVGGAMHFTGAMVVVPLVGFLCLNMIEAQFVTPSLVGQRLHLNPLLVFLAILFGLWLWGPVGGIVSLPILVWVLVFSGHKTEASEEPAPDPLPDAV